MYFKGREGHFSLKDRGGQVVNLIEKTCADEKWLRFEVSVLNQCLAIKCFVMVSTLKHTCQSQTYLGRRMNESGKYRISFHNCYDQDVPC